MADDPFALHVRPWEIPEPSQEHLLQQESKLVRHLVEKGHTLERAREAEVASGGDKVKALAFLLKNKPVAPRHQAPLREGVEETKRSGPPPARPAPTPLNRGGVAETKSSSPPPTSSPRSGARRFEDDGPYAEEMRQAAASKDRQALLHYMRMRKEAMASGATWASMTTKAGEAMATTGEGSGGEMVRYPPAVQLLPEFDAIRHLFSTAAPVGLGLMQVLHGFYKNKRTLEECFDWVLSNGTAASRPFDVYKHLVPGADAKVGELYVDLVQNGFEKGKALERAKEAWKRYNTEIRARSWALQLDVAQEEPMVYDPITMEAVRASQTYYVECKRHRLPIQTLYASMRVHLMEKVLPTCPEANGEGGCGYVLEEEEIEDVLTLHYAEAGAPDGEEVERWGLKFVPTTKRWQSQLVRRLCLRKATASMGCVECPTLGCDNTMQPAGKGQQRCVCEACDAVFCSQCRTPYHYRSACDDMMTLTRQWLEWRQHGREDYLRHMAQQDASYQAALADFEKARTNHEGDVRAAEQSWANLQADEAYKAQRCKRCPQCGRVIERMQGCDAMVCGQDAHGGNMQNGCGARFSWPSAPAYAADSGNRPNVPNFTHTAPQEAATYRHMLDEEEPLRCDECQEPIVGPRAECVHCPAHDRCMRCHFNPHPDHHVFRLHMGAAA